ncbi:LPS export ABC transporter periplasmic protein LptC [Neptunomonas japonica]|uniref:LPS export ABC transporter periplasmic protein LptC n=1 Tax=Neptunomonas japonica TaxID=417574 RepID=UPI00040885E5|nr:LPS export ABC transporter periplasmic protein LptC [Neptunomonas japonica]
MLLTRSKTRISLAILLLLPLFFYWIINSDSNIEDTFDAEIISGVDYFMKSATSKEFNENGELLRTLSANELNHFPRAKRTTLKQPHITLMADNSVRLNSKSLSGIAYDNIDRFDLVEQVIVTHNPTSPIPSVLKTSSLSLYQAQGTAKTNAPVEITQQSNTTTATGMIINYKMNTSELLSDVKGTFHAK